MADLSQAYPDDKFVRPARAPLLLEGQQNAANNSLLHNGRNPAWPIAPPISAPAWGTSPGAAAPNNGIPFKMPVEAPSLTTSPGVSGGASISGIEVTERSMPNRPAPASSPMPGVSVLERPWTPKDSLAFQSPAEIAWGERQNPRAAATNTPNNPLYHGDGRYGAPPNPETPHAPATPAAPPPGPSLAARAGGALRTVASLAVGAGVGYGAGKLAKAMSGVGSPSNAPVDAANAARMEGSASQIPGHDGLRAPAAQPYNFWTDNEVGRNVGNTMNALMPFGGAAAMARVPGALTRTAGLADAALVGGAYGAQASRSATQAPPAAPATAPVATPTPQGNTLPVSSTPVKFGPTDGAPLPQPNGNILRQGNSYSGMNVGGNPEDLRINNSPLRRGTVTSMGDNPGDLNSAQRMAMDQRAHDIQMQSIGLRQQLMDRDAPTPGMATIGTDPSSLFSRTPGQAARDAAVSASSITNSQGLSGRQRRQFAQADARLAFDRENSEQQNAATLRGQDLNFGAATRGQDLGHDASIYGHDVSRMNNKAQMSNALLQMQRDQSNKDREFEQSSKKTESELASADQTRGKYARDNAAADFKAFAPGKDGISMESPELSARSFDAVRKILPGFDSMTESARNERYPDAKILQKLFLRTQDQKQMGLDYINPLKPKDPALDAMPNLKGGVLKQQKLTGLATPGGSYGNWYIEHNGRDIPLGADMSARELEIVRHHLGTGEWLGAPKNIQKGN